jgi:hypothetical protein
LGLDPRAVLLQDGVRYNLYEVTQNAGNAFLDEKY